MSKESTSFILKFVLIMTTVVAVILALMATGLQPVHQKNEAVYNKRAILKAVEQYLDKAVDEMSDVEVQAIFDNNIEQYVINAEGAPVEPDVVQVRYGGGNAEHIDMAKERKRPMDDRLYPVFVYNDEGAKYYIVSVRGSGLWDEIWAHVALESDFNTIAGVAFDHKAETPGLGAEIKDDPNFSLQFIGKQLYMDGEYVSVEVVKGGAPDDAPHRVDGITGATVTAVGVGDMMYKGLKQYEPYFESVKEN